MLTKNFLDTSVARPLLLGTRTFRAALEARIGTGDKYVSPFVEMEFKRSYLCSIIEFYFVLKLANIRNVQEAFSFFSNDFNARKLKAVVQLAGQLFACRQIALDSTAAKPKAIQALAEVIIRIHSRFRNTFKNTGKDSTRCARAAVNLDTDLENAEDGFRNFLDAFGNTAQCQKLCVIGDFFVKRNGTFSAKCVQIADALPSSKETDGFRKVAEHLKDVLTSGGEKCSCRMCGNVGDAVIAFDAERSMPIHHIDQSFVQLCSITKQPQVHPSPTSE